MTSQGRRDPVPHGAYSLPVHDDSPSGSCGTEIQWWWQWKVLAAPISQRWAVNDNKRNHLCSWRQLRCHDIVIDGSLFPGHSWRKCIYPWARASQVLPEEAPAETELVLRVVSSPLTNSPGLPLASNTNSGCRQRHNTLIIPPVKWGGWIKSELPTIPRHPGCFSQLSVYGGGKWWDFSSSIRQLLCNLLHILNFSHKISLEESVLL